MKWKYVKTVNSGISVLIADTLLQMEVIYIQNQKIASMTLIKIHGINKVLITAFIHILLFSCTGGKKAVSNREINILRDSAYSNYWDKYNYETSYRYYNLLLKTKSYNLNDLFYAAHAAAFAGHYKRSIEFMDIMLEKYKSQDAGKLVSIVIDSSRNWNYYNALAKEKGFKKIYNLLEDREPGSGFLKLSELLNNRLEKDQYVRKQYQKNPNEENHLLWLKTDSVNNILVDSILNKYGFLSFKEIGYKANSSLAILYQHLGTKSFMDNFHFIKKASKEESILLPDYALILDRYLVRSNKKQEYGTQYYYDSLKKAYVFKPIRDFKNIEKRRWKMGLDSLAAYARYNKIILSDERKK